MNTTRRKGAAAWIEGLEQRVLFSNISIYLPPSSVIAAKDAIVNASGSSVVAAAANGITGPQTTISDAAMLSVLESHEGYSLSIYPDFNPNTPKANGHPTVGIGLNLDASGSATPLTAAGLDLQKLRDKWTTVVGEWGEWLKTHKVANTALNNGNPAWYQFYDDTPDARAAVMTDAQAQTVFSYSVAEHFQVAADFYGDEFYRLDRDPQIALVDLVYNYGHGSATLDPFIQGAGNTGNGTNYVAAAAAMQPSVFKINVDRLADDSALIYHGTYPSLFIIDPLSIGLGQTGPLKITAQGARGKPIVLPNDHVQFTSADTTIATVDGSGTVAGVGVGHTNVTETVLDDNDNPSDVVSMGGGVTVGTIAGVYDIPPDGNPVILTGVQAGQTVQIQASFSTNDPNENGEGEPLELSSGSGFSTVDDAYNATSVYSFIAGVDNDTLTASPQGWDGDEGATIVAMIVGNGGQSLSARARSAISSVSTAAGTAAAGSAGAVSEFTTAFGSDSGMAAVASTEAALLGLESTELGQQAVDPADSHFTSIATPARTTKTIFLTPKNFAGVETARPLAASINAVFLLQEKTINLANAADTTANRIAGAASANDKKWTNRQTAVLSGYKKQESALLMMWPTLLKRAQTQLDKANFGQTIVLARDVRAVETSVSNAGLPAAIVTTLDALGVDTATQEKIRQSLFAQDTTAASGTYDSIFGNAVLQTAVVTAGAELRKR